MRKALTTLGISCVVLLVLLLGVLALFYASAS